MCNGLIYYKLLYKSVHYIIRVKELILKTAVTDNIIVILKFHAIDNITIAKVMMEYR